MEDENMWFLEKQKLEEEQKKRNAKIKELSVEGLSIKEISMLFNLSKESVRRVLKDSKG